MTALWGLPKKSIRLLSYLVGGAGLSYTLIIYI